MAAVDAQTITRRFAALLLVIALGSGGLIIAAASPTDAAAAPVGTAAITSGHVDWGVKASFRSYITGPIAQGAVGLADGATTNADGTYHFPNASGSYDNGSFDAGVAGSVHFSGHAGALDMTVHALHVDINDTDAALRADVVSKSFENGTLQTFSDVALATLDLTGIEPSDSSGVFTWSDIPATLTADGAAAFSEFYPAGTELDEVTVAIELDGDTSSSSSTTSSSTSTSTTPSTTASTTTTTADPTDPPVEPSGERTRTGPTGQTLTVRPADNLDPSGATVNVTGAGYDTLIGIYLTFCVDKGPDVAPTPCLGGVDMEGSSGASVWISSNPPPYGVGLAQPFGPGGTFTYDLNIQAVDTDDQGNVIADCFDEATSCVITTRADHTQPAVRSADVKVPVFFVGQQIVEIPNQPTTPTSAFTGTPIATAPTATVLASGTLPVAGGDIIRVVLVALTLVGLGTGLVVVTRTRSRRHAH